MTTKRTIGGLQPPLRPRNGHTLKVLMPGRVSDPRPGKQDKQSLDDQEDIQRRWLARHTEIPTEVTVVAGSGSGEILEREEYLRLLKATPSNKCTVRFSAAECGRRIWRSWCLAQVDW
jgi:hypothetical protein